MIQRKKKGTNSGADKGSNEHTADDAGADGVAAGRARARTDGKGHAAEDEGQRSHHDGPETQTGGFFGRVHSVLAFVTVLLDGNSTIRMAFFADRPISVTRRPENTRRWRCRAARWR